MKITRVTQHYFIVWYYSNSQWRVWARCESESNAIKCAAKAKGRHTKITTGTII